MGRKMARGEMLFKSFALSNILILAIVAVMVILLGSEGVMIYIKEGVSFISTSIWSGARESYGILFALGGQYYYKHYCDHYRNSHSYRIRCNLIGASTTKHETFSKLFNRSIRLHTNSDLWPLGSLYPRTSCWLDY